MQIVFYIELEQVMLILFIKYLRTETWPLSAKQLRKVLHVEHEQFVFSTLKYVEALRAKEPEELGLLDKFQASPTTYSKM